MLLNVGELGCLGESGVGGGASSHPHHTHTARRHRTDSPQNPRGLLMWAGGAQASAHQEGLALKSRVSGSPRGLQPELLGALVLCTWGWGEPVCEGAATWLQDSNHEEGSSSKLTWAKEMGANRREKPLPRSAWPPGLPGCQALSPGTSSQEP